MRTFTSFADKTTSQRLLKACTVIIDQYRKEVGHLPEWLGELEAPDALALLSSPPAWLSAGRLSSGSGRLADAAWRGLAADAGRLSTEAGLAAATALGLTAAGLAAGAGLAIATG